MPHWINQTARSESSINPYTPTVWMEKLKPIEVAVPVTTFSLFLHAVTGIGLAGGLFGLGVTILILISSGESVEMLMLLPTGIVMGCVLATFWGVICLSIASTLVYWLGPNPVIWRANPIRLVSAVSGGLSGLMAVLVPMGLGTGAELVAVITGLLGLTGARLGVRRCVARAKQHEERLRNIQMNASLSSPLSFEETSP